MNANGVLVSAVVLYHVRSSATRIRALPAGTPVEIVETDEHFARIRYAGLPEHHEAAIVGVEAVAGDVRRDVQDRCQS
jgi:hypothetical protein